jgi:hypothetical protein
MDPAAAGRTRRAVGGSGAGDQGVAGAAGGSIFGVRVRPERERVPQCPARKGNEKKLSWRLVRASGFKNGKSTIFKINR